MQDGDSKGRQAQPQFTQLWATTQQALCECNANAAEWASLTHLMRYQRPDGTLEPKTAEEISKATGFSAGTVRRALASLTKKTFNAAGGKMPILSVVKHGRNNVGPTTYRLNVPRAYGEAYSVSKPTHCPKHTAYLNGSHSVSKPTHCPKHTAYLNGSHSVSNPNAQRTQSDTPKKKEEPKKPPNPQTAKHVPFQELVNQAADYGRGYEQTEFVRNVYRYNQGGLVITGIGSELPIGNKSAAILLTAFLNIAQSKGYPLRLAFADGNAAAYIEAVRPHLNAQGATKELRALQQALGSWRQ